MQAVAPAVNVVWRPLPGSQAFALDSRAWYTLFHGTRGPGKTAAQLMRYRRRVGLGYGPFWRGIIFDVEFKNLDDIVAQSERFFPLFKDGAKFLSSASDYKWVWPTGEELLFRHGYKTSDYDAFHGHEYPFIGFNELTKQPNLDFHDKIMSTNRSSFDPVENTPKFPNGKYKTPNGEPLPPIPIEAFSTTNPSGVGHNAVKRRFITPSPNGVVQRIPVEIFNPKTRQLETYVKTLVAIFGSYIENPRLPASYIAELNQITDPNLRKAWLGGSWDVVAGGAFDDLWRTEVHKIERFPIPVGWYIDRSFDWGSTHPFYVGWFAEANGEEIVLPSGKTFCPVKGSYILFAEWYGCQLDKNGKMDIGSNKGLKLSAGDVADGIIKREISLMNNGWIQRQPNPGPADNQIRDVREKDVETIEKKMSDKGVRWTESDKSPGSRRNGMQLFRDRLENALKGEGPAIYFMSNCEASLETIPSLPRDEDKPDDIDTTAEDHPYDGIRYKVLRGSNRLALSLDISFPR